jgi:CBS domain-containing protein
MNMTSLFAKSVKAVGPHTPLKTAAKLMRKHNVGALVVTEQDHPTGIVTDRDIALALCERDLTPDTPVEAVMTVPVETLRQDEGGVRRDPQDDGTRDPPVTRHRRDGGAGGAGQPR